MKRFLLLPLLVVTPFLNMERAGAATIAAVSVSTVSHHVKLTLIVPRRSYPRGALVSVTVRLENVSSKNVRILSFNPTTVSVLNAKGQEVYSPSSPFGAKTVESPGGKRNPPATLRPHQIRQAHFLVVLRGPMIEALATLIAPTNQTQRMIRGKPIQVSLTNEAPPRVDIVKTPTVHATVRFAPVVNGPLYLTEQFHCEDQSNVSNSEAGWGRVSSVNFAPPSSFGCSGNFEWIAYVGHLNHAVAEIDYTSP
jgi:hypothetical protein